MTDKVGVMFMAQNASSGVRTRHVDNRYHFVQENLKDAINLSKTNVSQEIYERHVREFENFENER
jgi:hypothetical protein